MNAESHEVDPRSVYADGLHTVDAVAHALGIDFLMTGDNVLTTCPLTERDVPLYNPACWPADLVNGFATLEDVDEDEPIVIPHHPDHPDSPFSACFFPTAFESVQLDADQLHAAMKQQRSANSTTRKMHGRTSRSHLDSTSAAAEATVDSDGDIVMTDAPARQPVIERHSLDSFRAELAKDPSGKVTLATPPPPANLLPPRTYAYHSGLIFSPTCPPPDPAFLVGCDCSTARPCFLPSGKVNPNCRHGDDPQGHASVPAYTSDGRLRSLVQLQNSTTLPVFSPFVVECNVNCACARAAAGSAAGSLCKNRVAQHGIRYELVVGQAPGKGLGLFAGERIPQGAFVVEYSGEVLTQAECSWRDQQWMARTGGRASNTMTYSFNMDWMVDGSDAEQVARVKVIEARERGNCSRFLNHSCSPNLIVGAIQYETEDPLFHRLGFFALRDIHPGEELSFDYRGADTDELLNSDGRGRPSSSAASAGQGGKRVGRKRSVRRGGPAPAAGSSSSQGVMGNSDDRDGPDGLYKFNCLCGSDKCRGFVL